MIISKQNKGFFVSLPLNIIIYLILLLFVVNSLTFAARPLITDDAETTGKDVCQLESWAQRNKQSTEFWGLPTCGLSESFDITIGMGYSNMGKTDYIFQTKSRLTSLSTHEMGVGFVAGAVAHPEITKNANQIANYYAYVPLTFSLLDKQAFIHTNVGWHYDRDIQEHNTLWGIGFEIPVDSKWSSVGETYGDYHKTTYWQLGVRYVLIPDVFQLDSSVGGTLNKSLTERWVSLGFRWSSNKLF